MSIAGVLYIFVDTFLDIDELERWPRIDFDDSDICVLLLDLEGEAETRVRVSYFKVERGNDSPAGGTKNVSYVQPLPCRFR